MKLAVISDIHEDYEYLERAFFKIDKLKCDEVVCLGDIVGYSVPHYSHYNTRNANKCIELISKYCKYSVAGNHDHFAIKKLPNDFITYNIPENWYNLSFDERKTIAKNKIWLYEDTELSALLNNNSKQWLSQLPEFVVLNFLNFKIFISHFIITDLTGFTTAYMEHLYSISKHIDFVKTQTANLFFFGHIHTSELLSISSNGNCKFSKCVSINSNLSGIGIPPIVRNKQFSGFAVLNAEKNYVELYSI